MSVNENLMVLVFMAKWQGINLTNIKNNCIQSNVEFKKVRTDQIKSNWPNLLIRIK